jgi:(S)-ureidoglycine aminohydrolase
MQRLGQTRSAYRRDHMLLTPETFVRAPLPGMERATAIVHVSPAVGAGFTQYTAEFESAGSMQPASEQRFVYVLEGELNVLGRALGPDQCAYIPAGLDAGLWAVGKSRAVVIEKPYRPLGALKPPGKFLGSERTVPPRPLMGDPDLQVRVLVPEDPSFDFAVNTMTFQPGAALPMVEMHVMEHGLLMLAGGGIYRLGECWYPVAVGDFIWMAPYCPQWFGAIGKTPAKYLIYKDWNR